MSFKWKIDPFGTGRQKYEEQKGRKGFSNGTGAFYLRQRKYGGIVTKAPTSMPMNASPSSPRLKP